MTLRDKCDRLRLAEGRIGYLEDKAENVCRSAAPRVRKMEDVGERLGDVEEKVGTNIFNQTSRKRLERGWCKGNI